MELRETGIKADRPSDSEIMRVESWQKACAEAEKEREKIRDITSALQSLDDLANRDDDHLDRAIIWADERLREMHEALEQIAASKYPGAMLKRFARDAIKAFATTPSEAEYARQCLDQQD